MVKLIEFIFIVIIVFNIIFTEESHARCGCTTANDKTGICVPIKECSELLQIQMNRYRSQADNELLRASRCDNPGEVCCETNCTTPNNKPGTCILITKCKKLNDMLLDRYRPPKETKLLQDSQCGRVSKLPKVCCDDYCVTPDGDTGSCVDLQDCEILNRPTLLQRPMPEAILSYMRKSVCGGPTNTSVCCGTHTPSIVVDELLPKESECGEEVIQLQDRMFLGTEAQLGEYPWLGMIYYRNASGLKAFGCGSSLISKRYAITAGHCLAGPNQILTPDFIVFGEHNTTNPDRDCEKTNVGWYCADKPVTVGIEKFYAHPGLTATFNNDIGIIRLAKEVQFTDFIRPICLPTTDVTLDVGSRRRTFKVAGWGLTEAGVFSQVKLFAVMPMVAMAGCRASYSSLPNNTLGRNLDERQVCVGGEDGKDSCGGDSGGPMSLFGTKLRSTLDGVVSFGPTPCGIAGLPGVYTKIFPFLSWIRRHIRP